jgi:cell division protein FtsL
MNAAAKRIERSTLFYGSVGNLRITGDFIGLLIMLCIMTVSAISFVYMKNYERTLFSDLQHSQISRQHLEMEWSQLLLEASTWSTPARIQRIAQLQYNMLVPASEKVKTVEL